MKYLYVCSWKSTLNSLFSSANSLLNYSIELIIKCLRNTGFFNSCVFQGYFQVFIADCSNALILLSTMFLKQVLVYSMV